MHLKTALNPPNWLVNNFHKISIKIRIDSKLIAMIFTKYMHTFLFSFDLSFFELSYEVYSIVDAFLWFESHFVRILFANCFHIQDFFCVSVMFDDMSCHVHWNFNFITQTIWLAMHSPLEIWFPCLSFVSAVDPVRFRFPLLYFSFFFLLINFLLQTQLNFRLISVFTLFFQSLNQQNKTINTNNERKIQNGIVLIHFVLVI